MNNLFKKLSMILLTGLFVFALSACADNDAEEAGEEIDEAVTEAGNAIEDACEDVKENVDAEDDDC